jgi:hypothetical protein
VNLSRVNDRECVVESKDPSRIADTSRGRSAGNFSDIWRIKGLAEQEFGLQHPITRKLNGMHADAQALLQENLEGKDQ